MRKDHPYCTDGDSEGGLLPLGHQLLHCSGPAQHLSIYRFLPFLSDREEFDGGDINHSLCIHPIIPALTRLEL